MLQYKKLTKNAIINSPAKEGDAGFDLLTNNFTTIHKDKIVAVSTGISLEIPKGYVGIICEKSGLALKKGIQVMGGIIDSGYRGEIKVILKNNGVSDKTFKPNDKIAQLLIIPCITPKLVQVKVLDKSDRGDDGFGSTGE